MKFKKLSLLNLKVLVFKINRLDIYKGFLPIKKRREVPIPGYTFVPQDHNLKSITTTKRKIIHNRYKQEILAFLTLAKQHNIKVLFVDIPVYSEGFSRETSSCEYSNYLSDFLDNIKVINFNKHMDDLNITPDDFDDSLHLMETGSRIISHRMGEILKKYINSNSIHHIK